MRLNLALAIIVIVVNVAVDGYIYWRMRVSRHRGWSRAQAVTSILFLALGVTAVSLPRRGGSEAMLMAIMWMLYAYLSIYIPKIFFIICDLIGLLLRWISGAGLRVMSQLGIVAAGAMFLAMWWGALVNRWNIDVREQTVETGELPQGFDGFKIAQISDLHTGTWGSDTTFVSQLVDSINALHPDLIAFTGDIVNSQSHELQPFIPVLTRLKAPYGVVSILGNHDYGDYHDWESPQAKEENMKQLIDMQRGMGWRLLLNDHVVLRRDDDSLVVAGVENIGDPPFPTYGDLGKATAGLNQGAPIILLSHNPAHWVDSICGTKAKTETSKLNIPLTLAGHTHAMQFSVLGHSPSSWRYPTWGGLYEENGKKIYVNIGAGTVGFPSRIGATPEITLLNLRHGKRTR